MWLFTDEGMISVVRHSDWDDVILMRARNANTIPNLLKRSGFNHKLNEQEYTPERDYAYRIELADSEYSHILLQLIDQMKYTNFKDHLRINKKMDNTQRHIYNDVYYTALGLTDQDYDN
jgi:hypothetical protein